MAKLYRIIPDTVTTWIETYGIIRWINEDLFYKLGYLSQVNISKGYFRIKNGGISWNSHLKKEDSLYFFFSPWACLWNSLYLDTDIYGTEIARVMEYEVPDEIITSCPQGYGYYNGVPFREIRIPISKINGSNNIETELTPQLIEQLSILALNDAEESFVYIESSATNNKSSLNKRTSLFDGSSKKDYLDSERQKRIISKRLANCGQFFKSDIITGNSVIITATDRLALWDRDYTTIQELCDRSNGIFNIYNLKEFAKEHEMEDFKLPKTKR